MTRLCFVLDQNVAWMKRPLRRRGFLVFAPGEDFPDDVDDYELLLYAERTGCVVVSTDRFFKGKPMAVYIPLEWTGRRSRYNSWDLVTKVVKLAAEARRGAEV